MKSEHLFIIRLGDGRHFEYEGTLDGAKRKASKLATPPVAIQLLSVGTAKWGGTLGSSSRGLFEQGRAPEQRAPVSY